MLELNNNITSQAITLDDIKSLQIGTKKQNKVTEANKKPKVPDENVEMLSSQLKKAKDNNGCFASLWNYVKTETGKGTTEKQCDKIINDYKQGKIEYEDALKKIEEYTVKQDDSLNLFSNIVASVAALGVTALAAGAIVASGGTATPFVLAAIGAGTGAVTKSTFKFIDRATNNVDNDALDANKITKDALSGAVSGGIATVTMGTAASAPTILSAVKNCGITGIKTGAVSGSANYAIDCAFDDNKDFKIDEFASNTLESTIIGGTVGALMGGANGAMHATGLLKSGCNFQTFTQNAGQTSAKDVTANSVCTAEYKILNDRISDNVTAA